MKAFAFAAFTPLLVHGFSNSVPIVAWSHHNSPALSGLPQTTSSGAAALLDDMLLTDAVCKHDAIVIVEQHNLLASDLRNLPSSSGISKMLSSCKSSRKYPYVRRDSRLDTASLAQALSTKCNTHLLSVSLADDLDIRPAMKHVVHMSMPDIEEIGNDRSDIMLHHATTLSSKIEYIASSLPDYLVVLIGSPASLFKRQDDAAVFANSPLIASAANSTLAEGGILKRYQLLTPGLLMALLVVFFVLVPIVMFGVSALSSIQSPMRLEAPKGYNAQDKKGQ